MTELWCLVYQIKSKKICGPRQHLGHMAPSSSSRIQITTQLRASPTFGAHGPLFFFQNPDYDSTSIGLYWRLRASSRRVTWTTETNYKFKDATKL